MGNDFGVWVSLLPELRAANVVRVRVREDQLLDRAFHRAFEFLFNLHRLVGEAGVDDNRTRTRLDDVRVRCAGGPPHAVGNGMEFNLGLFKIPSTLFDFVQSARFVRERHRGPQRDRQN